MPDDFDKIALALQQQVENALKISANLQSFLKDYGGELYLEASYVKGEVELDPITLLQKEQLATAKMDHYGQRGYIEPVTGNFKLQTLWEREELRVERKPAHLQDVVRLWVERYGACKWDEFKKLTVPDDPNAFWKRWTEKCEAAHSYLQDYFAAIAAIDETVADWYAIPDRLRPLLREKLPWTHGADRDDGNEDERTGD